MVTRAGNRRPQCHLSAASAPPRTVASVQDVSEDYRTMLAALRTAVAAPGGADRPGRLRQQLEAALGPEEARRQRRLVHQVVVAAEENLPLDLRRISPLTPQSLHHLSDDLAGARGWTPEAARRVTQLWASALGFADLAAASWPRTDLDAPAAPPIGEVTLLPPAPPQQVAASPAPTGPHPSWPTPPTSLARHSSMLSGEPALGATLGYAGMSLPLCVATATTLTAVLCLPILLIGATGALLPLLGVAGAKVLVSRLGRGALVASATGIEFVPYDVSLRTPRPHQAFGAPWSHVSVETGRVSAVRLAGRRVQVGPRNRRFADAAAHRARSAG